MKVVRPKRFNYIFLNILYTKSCPPSASLFLTSFLTSFLHNCIQLCIQCALPVVTIMALWQLLNLGTGCTVTHCWIALWSHESAQTASSERSKYANSEHLLRGSPPNPESAQTV